MLLKGSFEHIMDDTPIPLPREKSVTFHRAEHAVPVILFSGDPRRTSIIEIPDSTSQVAPEDVATEGVGGLRRCSASFKLMGFEPRVSGDAGNDSDSSESDTLFDPSASPVSPLGRNLRSGGRPGARSLEAKDVRRYRNASAVVAHKADTENRFAKWAHLTDDSELPQAFLRQCAEDFDRRLRLLSELFLFVVFLLLFVFFVVADNAVQRLYFNGAACTQPARQPIPAADLIYGPTWGPSFESTHTIVNVSDWLERVVVPAYWRRSNSTSSPTPDVFRLMLGNNIPLGGLTIRLQRRQYVTPVVTCATVSGDGNTTCTLSTAENKDTQVVGRQTKILMNDIIGLPFRSRHSFISFTPGEAGSYDWAGNTLIIPFSATYDDALDTIRRLRANATEGLYGLMDPSIQMVSVVATTFNPPLQYFARTEFLMEVPSSGVAIPSAHYWPFFLFTSEGHKGFAAYTVILFVYSLLMAVRWLLSIPASYRRGCLLELLSTIWFYVEAANLVALFVVFVIRFVWWSESDSVVESIAVGIGSTITTNTDLINMSEQLEYMAALYRLQTELNAINTVLFFLLILKYTSLHPTLERVTIAMRLAQQSIVGLFAVFVAILLAFAICGNALFGGELGDFRSIGWSFSSLMRMLLGDSDLPAMQDVNRVLAGMFYWAFLILGLFITLNFIMAVIGEALNHSERESATVFYVPLKQQYLLFVDNVMMQVRRLKAALRVIRQHQRKIRANEARAKKNSQSVPPSRRESQDSTVAADVQAEQRNITKWMVVRELATEWKVYLGDGLRAMLVGAAAVAASDRNGGDDRKFSAVLSFLTNTRYTSIVSALDEAAALRAAGRHRVFGDAEPTQLTSAPPPEGVHKCSDDGATRGPISQVDGVCGVRDDGRGLRGAQTPKKASDETLPPPNRRHPQE